MSYVDIIFELVVGYIALFITVKFLGKTQLSQITPFDFISALVLGDLLSSAVFDEGAGILKILLAIGVWGFLIYITEMLTQKSRKMRHLFEGKPSMIINRGKIDWREMKKNRLDLDQLKQMLRSKDVFSLEEVEYAIFENSGGISILKIPEAETPTCKDLKINAEQKTIPLTIISDGEILEENLKQAGLDENWLYKELDKGGVKNPKEVCYAEWQTGKSLYFQKY